MLKDLIWTAALALVPLAARPLPPAPAGLPATLAPPDAEPTPLLAEPVPEIEPAALPGSPGAAGTLWQTDRGQICRVPAECRQRRAVGIDEQVARFCDWMRDHELVGWHPVEDVVGFYTWFAHEERLEEVNLDALRERLAAAPGVTRERRRLNATTDPHLQRIRRRLGGVDRPMLYRFDSHEEMAAAAAEASASPRRRARPSTAAAPTTIKRAA